jgi:hypothetical protein
MVLSRDYIWQSGEYSDAIPGVAPDMIRCRKFPELSEPHNIIIH